MDEYSLMKDKVDPDVMRSSNGDDYTPLKVIIQTKDGLQDSDRRLVESVGGKVKDDLYIINAFSADIPVKGLKKLILSPRIVRIFNDGVVRAK